MKDCAARCINPCREPSGDMTQECGGCPDTARWACRPGAESFGLPAAPFSPTQPPSRRGLFCDIRATYAAAAGVWRSSAAARPLQSRETLMLAPIFRDAGRDQYQGFAPRLQRSIAVWCDTLGWKVAIPTRSLREARRLQIPERYSTTMGAIFFCSAVELMRMWSEQSLAWLGLPAYPAGCTAKLAATAVALQLGYNALIMDWDVVCHQDPMAEMIQLLYRTPDTHVVAPANQGRWQKGSGHHFNTFLLARPSNVTRALWAWVRTSLERVPASWGAFDRSPHWQDGDMGMVSRAMEHLLAERGRHPEWSVPRFSGVEEVPSRLLVSGKPGPSLAGMHCYHIVGPNKSHPFRR